MPEMRRRLCSRLAACKAFAVRANEKPSNRKKPHGSLSSFVKSAGVNFFQCSMGGMHGSHFALHRFLVKIDVDLGNI